MDTPNEVVNVNAFPEVDKVPDGKKIMFVDSEDNSGGTIQFEKLRNQIASDATDPIARAQIENLAKLPEGSTTGDAELSDIRVGADGTQYPNAGAAVREQIKNTKKNADEAIASLKSDLVEENNRAKTEEKRIEELFTMPTEEAVNKWLDEHPEATTTVRDHSLTIDKMVIGTLGYVTPQIYGAKGDGVTDDTVSINECLSGNDFIFFPRGTYIINPAIALRPKSNQTVVFDDGAILKVDTTVDVAKGFYYLVYCYNIENTIIKGGHFIGDKLENEGVTSNDNRHGLSVTNCKNIVIDGCIISGHRGDGVYCGSAGYEQDYEANHSKNIKLVNCEIYDCLRHGMFVDGIDGLLVKYTHIHDCYELTYSCAIDFETHYKWHKTNNIRLDGLRMENCKNGVHFNENVSKNSISGAVIENCTLDRRLAPSISGDVIINNSTIGIVVCNVANNIKISNCILGTAEILWRAKKVTLNNCVFNCTEDNCEALQFDYSDNTSNTEFEANNCVFNSYVSDVRNDLKAMFRFNLRPASLVLNGCVININNPNSIGFASNNIVKVDGCKFNYKFNQDGYPTNLLNANSKEMLFVGNTLNTTLAHASNNDKFVIASNGGNLFFANNIGIMTEKYGVNLMYGGKSGCTITLINNVFPKYSNIGSKVDGVTYVGYGNVFSDDVQAL